MQPQGRDQCTVKSAKAVAIANRRGAETRRCVVAEFRKILAEGGHPQGERNDASGLWSEHG